MQMKLYPYLALAAKDWPACWVFDDEAQQLKSEAFVKGMSEMITKVVKHKAIPNAEKGFEMTFSSEQFPGFDVELNWLKSGEVGFYNEKKEWIGISGNWYWADILGDVMVGWLCPALLKYFAEPPKKLYVGCAKLPKGINPIWNKPVKAYVQSDWVSAYEPEDCGEFNCPKCGGELYWATVGYDQYGKIKEQVCANCCWSESD